VKRSWLEPVLYGLLVLIVFAIAGVAVVWGAPAIPATPGLGGNAVKRAEEVGRNRTTVLALLAGLIAVIGAVYTAMNFQLARRGQTTDRFFKAVENLDASKSIAVRVGAIYALEALALEAPRESNAVLNVLRAFAEDRAGKGNGGESDAREALKVAARLTPSPTPVSLRVANTSVALAVGSAVVSALVSFIVDRGSGAEQSSSAFSFVLVGVVSLAGGVALLATLLINRRRRDPGPQPLERRWGEVKGRVRDGPEEDEPPADGATGNEHSGPPDADGPT
jgi:drug/metabolite transporter (DMT)-like permease